MGSTANYHSQVERGKKNNISLANMENHLVQSDDWSWVISTMYLLKT